MLFRANIHFRQISTRHLSTGKPAARAARTRTAHHEQGQRSDAIHKHHARRAPSSSSRLFSDFSDNQDNHQGARRGHQRRYEQHEVCVAHIQHNAAQNR